MQPHSNAGQIDQTHRWQERKWSPAEKAIARKAFDLALARELNQVLQQARDRSARLKDPSELWELESWLTERRKEIDRKYDYRYSVLTLVFAALLRSGHLSEEDLHGLGQDKMDLILGSGSDWAGSRR